MGEPAFDVKECVLRGVTYAVPLRVKVRLSIFDNVAFGLRLNRYKGDLGDRVKHALQGAALWDEVKEKLKVSGLSLSGGAPPPDQRPCRTRPARGNAHGPRNGSP